ncbi:oxalate decarboxylase [Polyporus arcularius HHB13444]|uniref:Oxalate decarboxylase n=1 Tax=Polyporus arcularius HHB13444 TaxID=1314778 RepID=A0A5C3NQM4_9APHY|nr:oxalate decarboxylase [Polyporus arcularius HHB13444]
MSRFLVSVLCAVLYGSFVTSIPIGEVSSSSHSILTQTASSTSVGPSQPSPTVPYASDDPNYWLWNETTTTDPQPERGTLGASILGPQDIAIDKQNPDILAPPTTDSGTIGNAKWPFSLSKMQLNTGGWVRQQNIQQMPLATAMAGVNMRLEAGAIRELHWHQTAEWAYVIKGSTQITSVDQNGRNYVATVNQGDLWYFPPGIPHSLQGTNDNPDGTEFLLIFPDGTFNDDDTLLLTDWMAHIPKEVIAKNFQDDISDWNDIPGEQLYIFPGVPPPDNQQPVSDPQGQIPEPFSYAFSKVTPTQYSGGTAKIADSTVFNVSTQIAVAEVTVEPGAMRELHWHPTQNEWGFFLEGTARVTIFAGTGIAQTFDYQPGDISYVPTAYGHYVENTGNTTLRFLEIFNSDRFEDVSLAQWLALTPPALVKQHLQLSDKTIAGFNKTKGVVVGGKKTKTTTVVP